MIVTNNINSSINANKRDKFTVRNYRKHYLLNNKNLVIPSPMLSVLSANRIFLLENAKEVELQEKYFCRPDLFANDYYGDPGLFFIILFVNDMFSFADFRGLNIKVPKKAKIDTVLAKYEPFKVFQNIDKEIKI